ncbi:MAG: hypothetical protein GY906_01120, partial [bacterium]|nr:hypothetical protein [bacterium]
TELRQLDEQQGPFAGLTVERYRYRYLEFLRIYTPAREPFTHEVQVHLQSRGVNIALAKQEQVGSRKQKKLATRAFRENQILETFFPVTLKHAEAWLSPKQSNTLRSGFLPDYRFVSLAGIRIITFASEKQLRVFLIICLIALIAAERWLARRG